MRPFFYREIETTFRETLSSGRKQYIKRAEGTRSFGLKLDLPLNYSNVV